MFSSAICMILLGVYYQVENLYLVPHRKWNYQMTGFALIIVIQNLRSNRLHNVQLWILMKDWQFWMMLLGVQYQYEIPFPVAHLGKKNGFALIIVIQILRGNKLHNISLCIHIRDWQFCIILLGVCYKVLIPFLAARLKNEQKTGSTSRLL